MDYSSSPISLNALQCSFSNVKFQKLKIKSIFLHAEIAFFSITIFCLFELLLYVQVNNHGNVRTLSQFHGTFIRHWVNDKKI